MQVKSYLVEITKYIATQVPSLQTDAYEGIVSNSVYGFNSGAELELSASFSLDKLGQM